MIATTKMAHLFAMMLLTPGVAADDVVALPLPPYMGRSGADLLLNSSQPDGAVLLNGHDIVSGVSLVSCLRVAEVLSSADTHPCLR